jgi:hypothetical protein
MTMKAKWLWMSWAYLALAGVIALEVLWIAFAVIMLVPKFQRLMRDGLIDSATVDQAGASWMPAFLNGLSDIAGGYTPPLVLSLAAVLCGLFEWRVRSENKPLMRLSALGTVAMGLMLVAVLTAGSLVIAFMLGVPPTGRLARQFALQQIASIDTSVSALEQALPNKDWEAMQEGAERAFDAIGDLAEGGPAIPALTTWNEPPTVDELRAQLKATSEALLEAQQAIRKRDAAELDTVMKKFRRSYEPVQQAARRATR